MQWVKTMVGVAGTVPGGSCGGVGSQGIVWQLWMVVAMVVAAESAQGVLCAQAEGGEDSKQVNSCVRRGSVHVCKVGVDVLNPVK